ncbi:hypothetical protein CJ030_MR4G006408 [Morella rubra]|uniref:Uncharacterized protein n=1 Tax=Morella rubra TaxID=262757 RepID=A0A6A1VT29_9ROSI|nr:hypothetical protein CJ030_MR4G006408 [Morella rubra]
MESLRRSITNVGRQTERPAWADAYLVELRESIRAIVEPTHPLYMKLQCRLTDLETKFAVTDKALTKELNIMQMELFSLQTLVKRVDNMEEHLAHVRDALNKIWTKPAHDLD